MKSFRKWLIALAMVAGLTAADAGPRRLTNRCPSCRAMLYSMQELVGFTADGRPIYEWHVLPHSCGGRNGLKQPVRVDPDDPGRDRINSDHWSRFRYNSDDWRRTQSGAERPDRGGVHGGRGHGGHATGGKPAR